MSDYKVVPITNGKKKEAEADLNENIARLLKSIECVNNALIKTGSEPLTLAFIFQDLTAITADMVRITKAAGQNSKTANEKAV